MRSIEQSFTFRSRSLSSIACLASGCCAALEQEEGTTARLQHRRQRDQEQRSEQTEVRQAWLDRRSVCRAAEQPSARQARLPPAHPRTQRRFEKHVCKVEMPSFLLVKLKFAVYGRGQTDRQTYTRVSHAMQSR